jgi:hypothetical protein
VWVQDGVAGDQTGQSGTAQEPTGQTGSAGVAVEGGPTGVARVSVEGAPIVPGTDRDGAFALRLATKSDLPGFRAAEGFLPVSNRTREGLDAFRSRLNALVFRDRGVGEDIVLTTERQFQAIEAARERVEAALRGMSGKPAIEILAFEIREAAGHLQELLGEISTDEILGKIFSGFCIGK